MEDKNKKSPDVKSKIDDYKDKAKRKFENYLEKRKENLSKNDIIFSESLNP